MTYEFELTKQKKTMAESTEKIEKLSSAKNKLKSLVKDQTEEIVNLRGTNIG